MQPLQEFCIDEYTSNLSLGALSSRNYGGKLEGEKGGEEKLSVGGSG